MAITMHMEDDDMMGLNKQAAVINSMDLGKPLFVTSDLRDTSDTQLSSA